MTKESVRDVQRGKKPTKEGQKGKRRVVGKEMNRTKYNTTHVKIC